MSEGSPPPPEGYEGFEVRGAHVVARTDAASGVRQAMASATLYAWASRHPAARTLTGRIPAYAVPLPGGGPTVVVRHAQHGGLLAPLTGDRFLAPTRAPQELDASLKLCAAGVPTPEIVAYALYPAGPLLARSDVATLLVQDSRDLAAVLVGEDEGARRDALDATAALLRALTEAGAHHPDLNIKNVLVAPAPEGGLRAYVLDVDRVAFSPKRPRIAVANFGRLVRSARKWRELYAAKITDEELERLAREAGVPWTAKK
ncbi:MAG TPA: lipopolysaccharide kinase InaA family protein [Gemmatimonadaceae bacterium]